MSYEENEERYLAAAHAVQTGVAYDLQFNPESMTPKHLRTGVNLAMVQHDALIRLLIAKGLFTMEQYMEALADATEREQRRFEDLLSEKLHANIKLG